MLKRHISRSSVWWLALAMAVPAAWSTERSVLAADGPADTAVNRSPAAAAGNPAEVARSINRFASDLYGKLSNTENLVVSPASISTGIAMTYSGARAETAKQIAETMHFQSPAEQLHLAFAAFLPGERPSGYSFGARIIENDGYGVKVTEVVPDTPAARAGLHAKDLILSINDEPIRTPAEYAASIDRSGGTVRVRWFNFQRGTVESQSVGKEPPTRLEMANAVWTQKGFPFSRDYVELLKSGYRGSCGEVDFRGSPRSSCDIINKWVRQQTHGQIRELMAEDAITSDCRLVLTNALYFKGPWEQPFPLPPKALSLLWKTGQQTVSVPAMSQTNTFNYAENDLFQAVELPYKESRLAMVVLLPRPEVRWSQFGDTLRGSGFQKALTGLRRKLVMVKMPKFRISTGLSLNEILIPTMPRAFSEQAEFGGISDRGRVRISAVVHQAFIDVDEKGTVAGAATSLVLPMKDPADAVFIANRPFVFVLYDRDSQAILFLGHLIHPRP